jgi:hypothetical protein
MGSLAFKTEYEEIARTTCFRFVIALLRFMQASEKLPLRQTSDKSLTNP